MGGSTGGGAVSIVLNSLQENIFHVTNMKLISNNYMGIAGGALYIQTGDAENNVNITNCLFQGNIASGEGAALYLLDRNTGSSSCSQCNTEIHIENGSSFINNTGDSIVYISAGSIESYIFVDAVVRFIKNTGTAIHLISSTFVLGSDVMFNGNSANNGVAMYLEGNTQLMTNGKIILVYNFVTIQLLNMEVLYM